MKTVNTCILVVVQTVHPWCHATVICQGFHLIQFELEPFWSSCCCIEVGYQLISLHMLAYVKANSSEQTILKNCRLNTWKNIASCVVHSHKYVRTHSQRNVTLVAALKLTVINKQTNRQCCILEPSAPWLPCHRTPGPFETTVCLLSISKWCSHCITHTHTHCPCVCQGVGLGPTA